MSTRETPDIETSSADYARRFAGAAGRYLLEQQTRAVARVLRGLGADTTSATTATPTTATATGTATGPSGIAAATAMTRGTATVLDVGGGHGQLVDVLRAHGFTPTVHGTDAACEANLRGLHGRGDCEFLLGDLHALPVPPRSYDVVVAVRLVSHVEDWPQLVAEMCRVARRAVVIDYPSTRALNALTPLLFGMKKSLEGNTRTYTSFAHGELARVFARHGFVHAESAKQFFLPMALHRAARGAAPLRAAEAAARATGLTALAGSPVIARFDRAHAKPVAAALGGRL